jgi:hypothetical protein
MYLRVSPAALIDMDLAEPSVAVGGSDSDGGTDGRGQRLNDPTSKDDTVVTDSSNALVALVGRRAGNLVLSTELRSATAGSN